MRACRFCLLALILLGLLAGCSPTVSQMPTPTGMLSGPIFLTPEPGETPVPTLLERRWLILEWPSTIREQDSDLIVLTVAVDEEGRLTATALQPGQNGGNGTPIDIPNIYDTHSLLAVARLDLAGMEAYRENLREPLLPGKPVTFRWSVRAPAPGVYRGIVWLHLEMAPRSGGAVSEMLLLSRPIEIQAVTVLGMPGDLARILGGFALAASTILGFPFVQQWIEQMRKRRGQPVLATAGGAGSPSSGGSPGAGSREPAPTSPERPSPENSSRSPAPSGPSPVRSRGAGKEDAENSK